ncbi:MAG TPA: serine/threonine-protein kinase [Burkholderiales bacterium]|nr:serine/threonine-protein kinase [Burkholderiales bacterium]
MSKAGFWKRDWFLGVVVAVLVFLASASALIQGLERSAYDWGVRASSRTPSDKVAVIAIDDESIRNIGRWPWSRDVHAKMADILAQGKAKVVGYEVFFSEPQIDPGLTFIQKLQDIYTRSGSGPNPEVAALLQEAEQSLNTDRKLSESYAKAGNVLLPMHFVPGDPRGKPDKPLPDFISKNQVKMAGKGSDAEPMTTSAVDTLPVEDIGKSATGVGHLNATVDVDGAIRSEPLVVQFFDQYFPSLSALLVAKSLNLGPGDIKVNPESVSIGNLKVATDSGLQMKPFFYKDRDGKPAFRVDSFFDVYSGKVPPDSFRDKIVLIGPTATGVGTTFSSPISPAMAPVLMSAHSVSSILQENFFVIPSWSIYVENLVYLLVAAYLIALLPRLKAGTGAAVSAGLVAVLLVVHFVLMTSQGKWLQLMLPLVLLVVGHVLLVTKRFVMTEAGKEKSDAASAANARMLGLAFQGQGQLDMAFDYFRKVPIDDTVMDNMYNLALDFERKRQFNKAESVFRYMADYNPKFRDLENRLQRAKQMSETVMLGGGSGGRTNTSILGEGGTIEKPMLGRYQVEKELGKGAMGVVYLGRDPKIGRVVAIKTMALAQEFEADELAEVKERFFREAETAGRLSHPNIVTIYDAGEEHDLCYIAMELLKGKDLAPYVKPDSLLPMDRAVSIIARVADALGYAHKQNIVHRDIKPANVMYEPESDQVKVADFGIARITDSSKTKTGMVLGTPSYMSPEQLSGKKVDGRSDLFSLAVSLYQLLSGSLPFVGDSMAQLMFKIANEPAPDIRALNPAIPPALVAFLERSMAKDADQRYQTGEEFAAALRAAMSGVAPAPAPATAPAAPVAAPAAASVAPAAAAVAAAAAASTAGDAEAERTVVLSAPVAPAAAPAPGSEPAPGKGDLDFEL